HNTVLRLRPVSREAPRPPVFYASPVPEDPGRPRPVTGSACRGTAAAAKMPAVSRGGGEVPMPPFLRPLLVLAAGIAVSLAACRPVPPEPAAPTQSNLSRPPLAVQALSAHMRS